MISAIAFLSLALKQSQAIDIDIKVDPRLEVLGVAMWLGGKFPNPTDSAYKLRVWNHFKKHQNHPAILALRKSKSMYTDFTELGAGLTNWPNVRLSSPKEANWRKIMGNEQFDKFFAELPDFIKKTSFVKFFASNVKEYENSAKQFRRVIDDKKIIAHMESFYKYGQSRPRPKFEIFLEPLNNWGAHAIVDPNIVPGDKDVPVRYQIGFWSGSESFLDSPLNFDDASSLGNTAWHEGSHVYIEPIFKSHRLEIAKHERLFNAETVKGQNISTWEYCLNENIVRAITAVLIKLHVGEDAYKREIAVQTKQMGFIYTGEIASWILSEYVGKEEFKDFDAYFPKLISNLSRLPDFQKKS